MSEMVERVARALHDAAHAGVDWDDLSRKSQTFVAALAKAAIAAMREPTGEMKDAGAESYGVPSATLDGQPSKAWRAMIDEALK